MDHGRQTINQHMPFMPTEDDEGNVRHAKMRAIVRYQSWILFVLVLAMCGNMLFEEREIYYYAMNDKNPTKPLLLDPAARKTYVDENSPKKKRLIGLPGATHTYQAITSWAGTAASDILNFGFHNVEQRMEENRHYFTESGFESFQRAIERSKFIERIKEKQQVVTAAPIGAPVIINVKKDPLVGTVWVLQIPFTVTILSGKQTQAQKRILMMKIVRVQSEKNLSGLGIDSWIEGQ